MDASLLEMLMCPRTGMGLTLEAHAHRREEVEYGVLSCEAGNYPVVSGIPIFLHGQEKLVELIRSGRWREATAVAAFAGVADSRMTRLSECLSGSGRLRRILAPLAAWSQDRDTRRGVEVLFGDGAAVGFRAIHHVYADSVSRSLDAFNYFRYRFGMPRHLVGLAVIEAAGDGDGAVLDLGCGAGHLTAAWHSRAPSRRIVGVDRAFFLLLAAREEMCPEAAFVCADATALPFPAGIFSTVLSSDVLSYVTMKSAALREIQRVLDASGFMMLTSVRNARCTHVFGGESLSPAGWRGLVNGLEHRIFPDAAVLDGYFSWTGLPDRDYDDDELASSQTLSVVASKGGGLPAARSWSEWPHARGALAINPLYRVAGRDGAEIVYRRHYPSATYELDNAAMSGYLPVEFRLPKPVLEAASKGERPPELEPLVSSLAVLAIPPRHVQEAWPDA